MMFNERVNYFQHLFGLDNWTINIQSSPQGEENHRAKTIADPRYNLATITTYPLLINDEKIWDEIIIHELIHVIMANYDCYADNVSNLGKDQEVVDMILFNSRENAVSQLTSVIMRLIKEGDK